MELALGQYNREGAATVWKICPVFKGECSSAPLSSTWGCHTGVISNNVKISHLSQMRCIWWPSPNAWSLCVIKGEAQNGKSHISHLQGDCWQSVREDNEQEQLSPALPFPCVLGTGRNWESLRGGGGLPIQTLEMPNPIQVSSALSSPLTSPLRAWSFLCNIPQWLQQ